MSLPPLSWRSGRLLWSVPENLLLQYIDKVVVVLYVQAVGDSRAPTVAASARSLTRPLCTTTGVMVQTVQFLDQVQLLGKVVDTPVVYNDRGHGPDRCRSWTRLLFARCFYDN